MAAKHLALECALPPRIVALLVVALILGSRHLTGEYKYGYAFVLTCLALFDTWLAKQVPYLGRIEDSSRVS